MKLSSSALGKAVVRKIVLLTIILITACSYKPVSQHTINQIDLLFSEYADDNAPGAALMVIKNGRVIVEKGYGRADLETQTAVTAETNFRLASLTKAFTAMSILQSVEDGKIHLDTKLTDIFPDFPGYGQAICIQDLLQHTSGLQDYEKLVPEGQTGQLKDADVLTLLKSVDSLYFVPGEKYKYSNSAYAILALVLEKVSGKSYGEYVRQNIIDPVGMKNSIAYEKDFNEVTNRAIGYTVKNDGAVEFNDQSLFSAVLGDGGIYSNLKDLFLWDQALYTNSLLDKTLLEQSFKKQQTHSGEYINYGFGWHLESYREMDVKYHAGSSCGFRNMFYRIPAERFTVIILSNRNSSGTMSTLQRAHKITDIFL